MYIFITLSYFNLYIYSFPYLIYVCCFADIPPSLLYGVTRRPVIHTGSKSCMCLSVLYLYNYFLCLSVGWGGLQYNADLFDSNIRIFQFYLFSPYASLLLFIYIYIFYGVSSYTTIIGILWHPLCLCSVCYCCFFDLLVKMR